MTVEGENVTGAKFKPPAVYTTQRTHPKDKQWRRVASCCTVSSSSQPVFQPSSEAARTREVYTHAGKGPSTAAVTEM